MLVFISGAMTLLLLSAGLSVDLGVWYREGAHLQRAADAAALAGVVYMPGDFLAATSTATTTLAKNGVVDGANNLSVTISTDPNPHRLKVCVADSNAPTFFTRIINMVPKIRKCATAEYQLAIPMGSPLSEMSATTLNGVDLAINGYCSASEDGDKINSRYRAMFTAGNRSMASYVGCPPSSPDNALYYDAGGYWYAVNVTDTSQDVQIDVYDGSYNSASSIDGIQAGGRADPQVTDTTFTVTDATLTPLDNSDDPVLATMTAAANDMSWPSQWRTIYTVPAGSRTGRYRINVTTSTNPESHDLNGFDLRARLGNGPVNQSYQPCSTIPGDPVYPYSTSCPQVFAEQNLGVYARTASAVANFYLASVDSTYAGHEFVVSLFDPGEGGDSIQLLGPDGNPVDFTWSTPDCQIDPALPCYSGSGTSLDVSPTPGALPNRLNDGIYNERLVELRVTLPSNYVALYGTSTWWSLRYSYSSGQIGDRTTWSVAIPGDPVRLVDGR